MIITLFILASIYFGIGLWFSHWHTSKLLKQDVMDEHTALGDIIIIFLWPREYKRIKNMK